MTPLARLERWLREAWDGRRPLTSLLLWVLTPSWIAGSFIHRASYRLGLRPVTRLAIPVIAVGNLTVGGAGKTPVALALAQRLLAAGRKVAVVSRGYAAPGIASGNRERLPVGTFAAVAGSSVVTGCILAFVPIKSLVLEQTVDAVLVFQVAVALWMFATSLRGLRGPPAVAIVSDGSSIRASASEGGDEPVWLAHRDPRLIVVAAEKRAAAAATAIDLGADVIILDDGLSHYGLHHDTEVLVVDDVRRFGNGRRLPAGPMRLAAKAGASADLVWYTRSGDLKPPPDSLLARPSVRSAYLPVRLVDLELQPREPLESLRGRKALALSGIAGPEAFVQTLQALGVEVRTLLEFPDHHAYVREDVLEIERAAQSWQCDLVLTTEKDAVRLGLVASGDLYRAVAMEVVLLESAALDAFVRRFAIATPEAA